MKGVIIIILFFSTAGAQPENPQAQTNGTTHPSEVRALNSIFQKWRISSADSTVNQWNTSGEPCRGAAVDSTTIDLTSFNPGIKCDCSYNDGSTCHITHLKVYGLDVSGVIPDELWNLTLLINLNLGRNYLTGPLSASISTLRSLQYLSLGINSLSGTLPREIGKLTNLITLAFGSNNFTGPLPSEIGSLTKLEQLYFDSSGVSGVIPSTFANLKNLQTMWGFDNELTGRIPDFIGNMSSLEKLRFHGNSFTGPIPTTLSKLTSLTSLTISDLSNGSSSLDFIKDMKSLDVLILRNNNISGSIPSNIGEYQKLSELDLSFNNLAGEIPGSLFSLDSLKFLFLGNNKLTGIIPTQKSATLQNIDLSYNQLSGTLPTWINQPNLQINIVVNNFTSLRDSVLPPGLNCLQRNFPCYRDSPIYYNFSIKCGGQQVTDSSKVVYEGDNQTLGPATYHVSAAKRWAVSNVGLPFARENPQYTVTVATPFTNTLDSELFQTARISAGSLRYYGLGLENGNYTVKLQFGEIFIQNTITWKSLGKRIFDVFIQGKLVFKDFDILKEAGGASYAAIVKRQTVQVSENYLEIHLFWAGKGTCCVPGTGIYGPTISAISATPEFIPSVSNNPPPIPHKKKNRAGLIVAIIVPVAVMSFLSLVVCCFFFQRRKKQENYEDEEFLGMDARPYTFSYAELRVATDDFNPTTKLGEGGFGPVYKGTLADGRMVAVKKLSVASRQGNSQFVAEIATVSAVQHRNLVILYGCCIEGDKRLLVYEYLENSSLDQALFGRRSLYLDWPTRHDICLGVARGLTYLHEESRLRIVHRDVKASNILLDSDLNPKVSDFGLAKLYDDKMTHITTRVAGTIGYLAPEYAMRGHLTEKVDVFGFGIVALEIVSGRSISDSNMEEEKTYLLESAWQLYETNQGSKLVDPSLTEFDDYQVNRLIHVALLCTQNSPTLRPPMSRVVAMLTGDAEVNTITTRPDFFTDLEFTANYSSSKSSMTKSKNNNNTSYTSSTSTSMLSDMN